MEKANIAVLVSGGGTNLQALIDAEARGELASGSIRLVVSNDYAAGKDVDTSRFFDRFYREDQAHTGGGEKSGYGIGLSIAEDLCARYNGSIRAAWKDGVITFTCLLRG